MSRKLRFQEKGAMYHVMSRGNLKQDIFGQENDKAYFLKLLQKGAEKYHIHIFAYCLMDNHYHLSLRINSKNLSEFMHFLGSSYANYKVRSGWVGHIFSGRYKSIRVEEEEYFLIVNRYIHLNPVGAGIVDKPEEYSWSNYRHCICGVYMGWLQEDWLAEYFGPVLDKARIRYRQFVEAAMGMESYYPENEIVAKALLGSEVFVKRIKASIREGEWAKEVAGNKVLKRIASLDEVHHAVCDHLGLAGLEQGDYRGDEEYRYACWLLIYMARGYTAASFDDIAGKLGGIKENAASHRHCAMRKRLSKSSEMQARLDADEKRILEMIEG
jgi:putative transposase